MNPTVHCFKTLEPSKRMTCASAAVACTVVLHVGLLALFAQASSEPWLTPTPQLLQAKARCDALNAREARTRCSHDLVARALAGSVRMAQAGRH